MMTMRKRVLPLGMAIFLLLTALFPVWAIAGGEATPAEVPMESVSPYRIILTAPGGWTSGNGAVMKVSITDKDRLGWQKIEYRMNDGNWVDCENLFADGRAELTFHENGTFTLRVTDPHGHAFEESAEVTCIDLTAPVLTASINGTTLQVDTSSFAEQQGMSTPDVSLIYGDYTRTALYAFESILKDAEHDLNNQITWKPIEAEKADWLYSSHEETDAERGCVGYLRGDFGRSGTEFWTSWFDHSPKLNNEKFRQELQTVVDGLRNEGGLLSNFASMGSVNE